MTTDSLLSLIYNRKGIFEDIVYGEAVVFIGKAYSGPSLIPIMISSIDRAEGVFGEENELVYAYREYVSNGGGNAYLIKINGTHNVCSIQNAIEIVSVKSDDISRNIQYEIVTHEERQYLTIRNTSTFYNKVYDITRLSIERIVDAINGDAIDGTGEVIATIKDTTVILVDEAMISNNIVIGENGFSNDYKDVLSQLTSFLEAYPIAQLGLLTYQFFEQDVYDIIYEFVSNKAKASEPCIVTLGFDMTDVDPVDRYLIPTSMAEIWVSQNKISEFISIILCNNIKYSVKTKCIGAYCGLLYSLTVGESTTNKPLYNVVTEDIGIPSSQITSLTKEYGYVLVKERNKEYSPILGSTLVKFSYTKDGNRSIPKLMSNIGNSRLLQYLAFRLSALLDIPSSSSNDLSNRIDNFLLSYSSLMKDYTFNIETIQRRDYLDKIINLYIVPYGELETISIQTNIR